VSDRTSEQVITEVHQGVGRITLQRPEALNALSLPMIRALTHCLRAWRDDPAVRAVAIRGSHKSGPFGAFCAGGDIRFFHTAALAGDSALGDFFTEEYRLNHLIHTYPKPYIAFMDGVVMGGGMGLAQGAACRIVTERSKLAMPETQIGLFPDVAGGYFLSRTPGRWGEYLALTGATLTGPQALSVGLADVCVASESLPLLWEAVTVQLGQGQGLATWQAWLATERQLQAETLPMGVTDGERIFALPTVADITQAVQAQADAGHPAAQTLLATLAQKSPLMQAVSLRLVRQARSMALADELRLERDLIAHTFDPRHLGRTPAQSDAVEGIRALAVDKDRQPRWSPARLADVDEAMVAGFFESPWSPDQHPLRDLRD